MKKILTGLALAGTMVMAGGDIAPVEAKVVPVVEDTKDFYVGINTVVGVGGERQNIDWFGMTNVGVLGGYTFTRKDNIEVSVEARYSTKTSDLFKDYTVGAYVKPGYDLGGVTAYGLVGYQDASGSPEFDFGGEVAYGGGVTTDILGYDVFADYLRGDKTRSEIVTIGVNYRF